ncbi:MAG: penicillin-binding protein 2, partial [Candidatus Eiseniibacteriota bacterium]
VYIAERRDRLPGAVIEEEPMRRYVYGALAAHALGYVGEVSAAEIGAADDRDGEADQGKRVYRAGDLIGRTGIERRFEAELGGRNGRRLVEVSALGRRNESRLGLPRYGEFEAPTNGADIDLTIDLDIQRVVEEVFPADHAGAVVVLDVTDGGVIAVMSRPAFDPNAFARGLTAEEWRALESDPQHPQHNRALMSGYPPGSVFKPVTGLAALGSGAIDPRRFSVDCEGGWQFGNRWFRCHHVHGLVAFEMAMILSCDTYFYQAGVRTGLDAIADAAIALGFGKRCGIELPESKGFVPSVGWYNDRYGKHGWTRGVVLNLAIGQGEILATPLQLASMMATLANRGRPVRPHLVRSVGGVRRPVEAPSRTVDADASTMSSILRALEGVIAHPRGTGHRARVEGIRIAGKTGTAQNPHGEDHALFAGFAPCDAPRIAFAVVVENAGHGGEMAAPVAAAVVRACLAGDGARWAIEEPAAGLTGPGD